MQGAWPKFPFSAPMWKRLHNVKLPTWPLAKHGLPAGPGIVDECPMLISTITVSDCSLFVVFVFGNCEISHLLVRQRANEEFIWFCVNWCIVTPYLLETKDLTFLAFTGNIHDKFCGFAHYNYTRWLVKLKQFQTKLFISVNANERHCTTICNNT